MSLERSEIHFRRYMMTKDPGQQNKGYDGAGDKDELPHGAVTESRGLGPASNSTRTRVGGFRSEFQGDLQERKTSAQNNPWGAEQPETEGIDETLVKVEEENLK